jgi:ribosomal protein S18 acetylase RimI-like enzyme
VLADAADMVAVLESVVAERVHSAIDAAWSVDGQRQYLESLTSREVCHVAVSGTDGVVGYQSLDRYRSLLDSARHVATVGTFVTREWRGRGVGHALFLRTALFARSAGFTKLVIEVRASNEPAQAFYRDLGFVECGRLARQVSIDGTEDDQVVMEAFL